MRGFASGLARALPACQRVGLTACRIWASFLRSDVLCIGRQFCLLQKGPAALDLTVITIALLAYLIAGLVKGTTGLGFSTTCLPFLVFAVGMKEALPLVIVPSLVSNATVMRDAGHFRETVWRFRWLYLALLPGIAGGLWVLDWVDGLTASGALGAVLCIYSAYALFRPERHMPDHWERPLAAPVGLFTGFVNGITGTQVMPLLPYMLARPLDPNRLVQAINCSFTISSLAMAAGLTALSLFTLEQLALSAAGVPAAIGGVKLGGIGAAADEPGPVPHSRADRPGGDRWGDDLSGNVTPLTLLRAPRRRPTANEPASCRTALPASLASSKALRAWLVWTGP